MKTGRIFALGLAIGMMATSGSAIAGDSAAGEKVFKKRCKACHTVTENKHKVGPSLFGVVGRQAGSTDFKRYKGLKGADYSWDEESLDTWLKNPKAVGRRVPRYMAEEPQGVRKVQGRQEDQHGVQAEEGCRPG